MRKEPVPFYSDVSALFGKFAREKHAILFDSGWPEQQRGRFDILSAWPQEQITISKSGSQENSRLNTHMVHQDSHGNRHTLRQMEEVKALLSRQWSVDREQEPDDLPFSGGWMGFSTYELGHELEPALGVAHQESILPLFWAGYYGWAIIQDHHAQEAFLVYGESLPPELLARIRQFIHARLLPDTFLITRSFRQNINFNQYKTAFDRIQAYLQAGDCYQVNFAMHYRGQYEGEPFAAYRLLRAAVPSPHMAYLNHDNRQILSISPERFIQARGNHIETKPIKGTAPRFADEEQDRKSSGELAISSKNRAENLMIVDLLRNDLGRHCLPGSIKVDELCAIETYANVHHLVSTISGELAPGSNIWDSFFSCFPGGSITGAPKIRAVQIIGELEQQNREIYCGALFYASNNGRFDSSIAIRTLLCDRGDIHAWAGGGIVADSAAEDEYRECREKIGRLLQALESGAASGQLPGNTACSIP